MACRQPHELSPPAHDVDQPCRLDTSLNTAQTAAVAGVDIAGGTPAAGFSGK